mgnify:FL=1
MENISLTLIILSFLETFILATLNYSLLSIKKFDRRFFILVVLLTIVQLTVRNLPVIPFVIMFSIILVYAVYFKYVYNTSIFTTSITVIISYLFYSFVEGLNMSITPELLGVHYLEVVKNPSIRFLCFSVQVLIMLIITGLIIYFKVNLKDLTKFFDFEDLKLLADDEMDFSRERRVVATFFLVITFLLIQGLFINVYLMLGKTWQLFTIHKFFSSPYFINTFIIVLNIVLLCLLRHLIITLRIERNDIIARIKEKNALRLDWEKRAQIHDQNHHLSMIYMLLQVNNVDRAKEYLKGMVGEIQKVDAIVRSGNQALNALIMSKISRGKQAGVDIKIDVLRGLSPMKIYDWDLNRILGNLLDNAIEALENVSGEKIVELIIEGGEESNRLEVITRGVYLPDEVEARIFQRGYSSKEEAGHGLGLAICKELVDEYNGSIYIKKDIEGNYTSFEVVLPVA